MPAIIPFRNLDPDFHNFRYDQWELTQPSNSESKKMNGFHQAPANAYIKAGAGYVIASAVFCGAYLAIIKYIDSLPCTTMLCNLDVLFFSFLPIILVAVLWPVINYILLRLNRRSDQISAPRVRLLLSAVSTGVTMLTVYFMVSDIWRRGFDNVDTSPQSLIFWIAFVCVNWLNLLGVHAIIKKWSARALADDHAQIAA